MTEQYLYQYLEHYATFIICLEILVLFALLISIFVRLGRTNNKLNRNNELLKKLWDYEQEAFTTNKELLKEMEASQ